MWKNIGNSVAVIYHDNKAVVEKLAAIAIQQGFSHSAMRTDMDYARYTMYIGWEDLNNVFATTLS